jgi:hypothetical protein
MHRGTIVTSGDGYRIYQGDCLGSYFFTTDYDHALQLSQELTCIEE